MLISMSQDYKLDLAVWNVRPMGFICVKNGLAGNIFPTSAIVALKSFFFLVGFLRIFLLFLLFRRSERLHSFGGIHFDFDSCSGVVWKLIMYTTASGATTARRPII